MNLHPAEIADEIKAYPFFASFDKSLLLQISTMVRVKDFPAGAVMLQPQQQNDTLYFIRSGVVEIIVDGERVNELNTVGEVLGEMSVLSGKPVSALIRAQTSVKCFCISAEDFAHVPPNQRDRFQFLLYRIYSGVLTDRLMKTNEKAKLYEITARELSQKKRDLEMIATAQMNFMRHEAPESRQKVLLLEPNKKQQNIVKTAVGSTGVQISVASTDEEARKILSENVPDVILCDDSSSDFLRWTQTQNYQGQSVLLISPPIDFQKLQELSFVQNLISRDPEDRAGTVKHIITALSKILHHNYFGVEKQLSWGTDIKHQKVRNSKDREFLKEQMFSHFKSLGVRNSVLDRVQLAVEEMLMNAIYDAPVDSQGKALFNHLPRTTEVHLQAHQEADFRYGCDGNILAVSVQDTFGALPREVILKYLKSCYEGAAGSLNTDKGGAGRGLHQILESCDWTIFNIKPGGLTEVIGVFDIDQKKDTPPQLHYFFVK